MSVMRIKVFSLSYWAWLATQQGQNSSRHWSSRWQCYLNLELRYLFQQRRWYLQMIQGLNWQYYRFLQQCCRNLGLDSGDHQQDWSHLRLGYCGHWQQSKILWHGFYVRRWHLCYHWHSFHLLWLNCHIHLEDCTFHRHHFSFHWWPGSQGQLVCCLGHWTEPKFHLRGGQCRVKSFYCSFSILFYLLYWECRDNSIIA